MTTTILLSCSVPTGRGEKKSLHINSFYFFQHKLSPIMKAAVLPSHIHFARSYVDSSGPMKKQQWIFSQLVLSLPSRCTIISIKMRMEGIGLTFSASSTDLAQTNIRWQCWWNHRLQYLNTDWTAHQAQIPTAHLQDEVHHSRYCLQSLFSSVTSRRCIAAQ